MLLICHKCYPISCIPNCAIYATPSGISTYSIVSTLSIILNCAIGYISIYFPVIS